MTDSRSSTPTAREQYAVVGSTVLYAGAPYVVTAVNDNLLTLDGITTIDRNGYGRCRPRCTVLEGDVVVIDAAQATKTGQPEPKAQISTTDTGGCA